MRKNFMINGLPVEAVFDTQTVEEILRPLLLHWQEMQCQKGERVIVFLAAPPGTARVRWRLFWKYWLMRWA